MLICIKIGRITQEKNAYHSLALLGDAFFAYNFSKGVHFLFPFFEGYAKNSLDFQGVRIVLKWLPLHIKLKSIGFNTF